MKKISWWEPMIGESERALVNDVLASNFINDGKVTTDFENRLADLLECRHVVAVTSGTAALFMSLAVLNIGPGDEVIVPDATFIATVNAVAMSGATPVLADIDPVRLTLSPESVSAAITPKTKAVIPVHVSGRAADMEKITKIAEAHGLHVIEDAAEAFMSKRDGRYLGTFGVTGCFSFSPLKLITTGQGGVVTTNDEAVMNRLRQIKDQGRLGRSTGVDYVIPSIGYNFKLTNLQAAVGMGQLETLDWRMARLRGHYRVYERELDGIEEITLPGFDVENGEVPLWTDVLAERRDELEAYLRDNGIDSRRFWIPIHTQPSYRADGANFPNCTQAMNKALWLPADFDLTEEDVKYVCDTIREYYTKLA